MSGPIVLDRDGQNIIRDSHKETWVSIVLCPGLCGNRLVHLSFRGEKGWVIRDYISGKELHASPVPKDNGALISLADVGKEVLYSEFPPNLDNKPKGQWKTYLTYRSSAVLKERGLGKFDPSKEPSKKAGKWVVRR